MCRRRFSHSPAFDRFWPGRFSDSVKLLPAFRNPEPSESATEFGHRNDSTVSETALARTSPTPNDGRRAGSFNRLLTSVPRKRPRLNSTARSIQLTENFVVGGKSICLMFGINQVPIHDDVEDSAAALDQFRLDTRCLLDRVRQTGGLRGVVSLHAVGDAYLHSEFLCWPDVRKRGYLQTASNQLFKRREDCNLSSQCRANAEFCRDNVTSEFCGDHLLRWGSGLKLPGLIASFCSGFR